MVVVDHLHVRDFAVSGESGAVFFANVLGIFKGTYDSYGWMADVDEQPFGDQAYMATVFFHEKAWDFCQGIRERESDISPWMTPEIIKSIREASQRYIDGLLSATDESVDRSILLELSKVIDFAKSIRRNILAGLAFKGHQTHLDREERAFENTERVHRLVEGMIADKKTLRAIAQSEEDSDGQDEPATE